MRTTGTFQQTLLEPVTLGLNGVTLAAERTSNSFSLVGVSQLSVFVNHSANASATRIDVNLDVTPDGYVQGQSISTWYKSQSVSIAAGTATLSELDVQKTVSAATQYEIRFTDLNAAHGRIRISATGGAAGDLATVTAFRAQPS